MRHIISILVAVFTFGMVATSASADIVYKYGRNGHLSFSEVPTHRSWGQRQHFNAPRYNWRRSDAGEALRFLEGVAKIGLGVGMMAIALDSKNVEERAYAKACADLGGEPVKIMRTGELTCIK